MTLAAGDTFLITDPDFGKQHLRIVLTGPTGTPPSVLTVQLNTATALADRTTVLCIGDHPFCRRETVVSYDTIHVMEVALLAELEGYQKVIDGARAVVENYRPHIDVNPAWPMVALGEVCERVQYGLSSPLNTDGLGHRTFRMNEIVE